MAVIGFGIVGIPVQLAAQSDPQQPASTTSSAPGLDLDFEINPDTTKKHRIDVSADYLAGFGEMSLPFNFAFQQLGEIAEVRLEKRDSTYFGGTISYAFNDAWQADFTLLRGESKATAPQTLFNLPDPTAVEYKLADTWYQAYVRYSFPQLNEKNEDLAAYLRVGGTFVDADLSADGTFAGAGYYKQVTPFKDFQGNLGFGLRYSLITGTKVRLSAVVEAEGFGGVRSQTVSEDFLIAPGGLTSVGGPFTTEIDNLIYGGLGRGVMRFERVVGASARFRIFVDGGVQARYTSVDYGDSSGLVKSQSFGETLWGPYAKLGVKYSF